MQILSLLQFKCKSILIWVKALKYSNFHLAQFLFIQPFTNYITAIRFLIQSIFFRLLLPLRFIHSVVELNYLMTCHSDSLYKSF